jgi:hypothetical protein
MAFLFFFPSFAIRILNFDKYLKILFHPIHKILGEFGIANPIFSRDWKIGVISI